MKPPNFRSVEPDTCANCAHVQSYRHCSNCPTEYSCVEHDFGIGEDPQYICDDWEDANGE